MKLDVIGIKLHYPIYVMGIPGFDPLERKIFGKFFRYSHGKTQYSPVRTSNASRADWKGLERKKRRVSMTIGTAISSVEFREDRISSNIL